MTTDSEHEPTPDHEREPESGAESTAELSSELIRAEGLGLRTRRGWVFQDVDLIVSAGSVTALAGQAGSGRSMLLLTLAGRAKPTAGRVTVAGTERRAEIRQHVAVARITAAVELEPEMQVIDHIREAELLNHGNSDYRWAAGVLGLDLDPTVVVADLATDDAVLFAVALALAGRPKALVVDDVDIAAGPTQQARIWSALGKAGTTVIASTVDGRLAAESGADVVTIQPSAERNTADARG